MTLSAQGLRAPLPAPDSANFQTLKAEDVVIACLASLDAPTNRSNLVRRLKRVLSASEIGHALDALTGRNFVKELHTNLVLTPAGRQHSKKAIGLDQAQPWNTIVEQYLLAHVLGLNPSDKAHRKRVADGRGLPVLVVAAGYGLPRDTWSAAAVRSELVWRVLLARVPELVRRGSSLPVEEKPDRHSRAVLLGLAGLKSGNVQQALAVLAARCVGLEKAGAEELRMALVRQGLRMQPEARPQPRSPFAKNVLEVARDLATPPFEGRVAIAQVYDAYGKHYADAGSLADFKRRLVDAARGRELSLQRVDMPELMSRDLRERSQTPWGSDIVHLVVVEWL